MRRERKGESGGAVRENVQDHHYPEGLLRPGARDGLNVLDTILHVRRAVSVVNERRDHRAILINLGVRNATVVIVPIGPLDVDVHRRLLAGHLRFVSHCGR